MSSIKVKVAYFALARELAGTKEEEFLLTSPANIGHLLSDVFNAHPKLREIKDTLRTLVNGQASLDNIDLKDDDHVTLFPPVGGG